MMVRLKDQPQEHYPVWESIVLLKAKSDEDGFARAEEFGRAEEGDDGGTFTWGGKPAAWVFAGVRKLTQCVDAQHRPNDGTELSYLEMELPSLKAVERFVQGRPTRLLMRDQFAEGEISRLAGAAGDD